MSSRPSACLGPQTTLASRHFVARQLAALTTAAQHARYTEIMTGREVTKTNVYEAVDVVLREHPVSGCCADCAAILHRWEVAS